MKREDRERMDKMMMVSAYRRLFWTTYWADEIAEAGSMSVPWKGKTTGGEGAVRNENGSITYASQACSTIVPCCPGSRQTRQARAGWMRSVANRVDKIRAKIRECGCWS
jgi:hypothetical protein